MTIQEFHDFFDEIIDKVGSPYLTDDEKDLLFNRAQISVLEDLVYNRRIKDPRDSPMNQGNPSTGFENTEFSAEAIKNLIVEIPDGLLATSTGGRINYSSIETLFPKATKIYHISNLARKSSGGLMKSARYVRHNDYYSALGNVFKAPSDDHPIRRHFDSYIQIDPKVSGVDVEMTVIRFPEEMDLATSVGSELSEQVHNNIVFQALRYAGVSIRDMQEFWQPQVNEEQKEA